MFEQERFISRLQRHAQGDPAVLACFLYGSYGGRVDDPYSDVDIALVYAGTEDRASAWAGRHEFVKAVMPYVAVRSFDSSHVIPYLHIALYSNGTKADFRFDTADTLSPDSVFREIRILKDRDGWVERFQAASSRLAPAQPYISPNDLTDLDNRFWVMFWNVLRLLKRNDTDKPFASYVRLLYFSLPPLLDALPPEEPARRSLMRATYTGNIDETLRGMGELLEAYLAARAAVIRRQNLVFPINTAFESEIRRLVERMVR